MSERITTLCQYILCIIFSIQFNVYTLHFKIYRFKVCKKKRRKFNRFYWKGNKIINYFKLKPFVSVAFVYHKLLHNRIYILLRCTTIHPLYNINTIHLTGYMYVMWTNMIHSWWITWSWRWRRWVMYIFYLHFSIIIMTRPMYLWLFIKSTKYIFKLDIYLLFVCFMYGMFMKGKVSNCYHFSHLKAS